MVQNKTKAFTLIEMLVVITMIGIILAIVLPTVSTLVNNRSRKMYETHMDVVVESATNLYVDKYKGELDDKDTECFRIDYQTLINEELVKETDVFCEGSIIVTKNSKTKNKENSYYLTCKDSKGNIIHESEEVSPVCQGFNGKFKLEYEIYEDNNKQKPYDGSYYVRNAYVYFSSTSPYSSISHYEYETKLDENWKNIVSGSNLGSINDTKNLVGNLYVRAVDQAGNKSSSEQIPVKMDNIGPEFSITQTKEQSTKILTISNVIDKQVGTLSELAYSFDGGNTWQKENTKSFTENQTVTVCSRDILDNRTCKEEVINDLNNGQCNLNCDTNNDGKCDLNCDTNNDGVCDKNCDTNNDGICDLNCDTDSGGSKEVEKTSDNTLKRIEQFHNKELWQYKSKITKIIIQNKLNPITGNKILSWNISESGKGNIIAYYDPDTTIAYIQGDGKIYANEYSSYLFYYFQNLTTIEGLEYLDTSHVVWMSYMFCSSSNLISLNVSNWNVSKVVSMDYMFYGCGNLTSLTLDNWDLSQTPLNMNYTFCGCSSLTTTINITSSMPSYDHTFSNAATKSGAKITVNYTNENSKNIDKLINSKSSNSNVVKGKLIN